MSQRPALPLVLALLLATACKGKDDSAPASDGWLLDTVDQGEARAIGEGFSPESPDDIWFAAEQIVPGLAMDFPASGVPLYLWDLVQNDNIADIGSCPYSVAEGETLTWKTGSCRSQEGYEWSGEIGEIERELTSDQREYLWDMSLEILGDADGVTFDRLSLEGALRVVRGNGDPLDLAVQVNARAGVDGYWERVSVSDPREAAWADWVMTARYEQSTEGFHMEGLVDLGEQGGLRFRAEPLTANPSCTGEPDGTLLLEFGGAEYSLLFDGSSHCDRCADYSTDGEFSGRSCGH